MRPSIPLASLDSRRWEPMGPAGLMVCELSHDDATRDRTVMLRSPPRPSIEHKAQFHLGEEEFYCLDGEFTFDGVDWFRPGSYVHFPAKTVHGARVHVPSGYLLYLRTSGDATPHRVEAPLRPTPYLLDEPASTSRAFTFWDGREGDGDGRRTLRRQASSDARVELIRLRPGEPLVVDERDARVRVELLLIQGALGAADGTVIGGPAYGHYPDGIGALQLRATTASVVLAHIGEWS